MKVEFMQGNKQIIDQLNEVLSEELAAIDQYFVHSRMYQNWGYTKLFERADHESADEKLHVTMLIQRILFLEGTPAVNSRAKVSLGKTVPEMLQSDLDLELRVVKKLREVIALCESLEDFGTRKMLVQILVDSEEDHTLWLEQQLNLINKLGLEHYLASKI
jgi:bacterioferritin